MSGKLNIPAPGSQIIAARQPLWVRVHQIMQAMLVTQTKGNTEPNVRELAAEVDSRLTPQVFNNAVNELLKHKLLDLATPPEQARGRRFRIANHERFLLVMTALSGDRPDTSVEEVRAMAVTSGTMDRLKDEEPVLTVPWYRRWFTRRGRELRLIERRLATMEAKLDRLLELWS